MDWECWIVVMGVRIVRVNSNKQIHYTKITEYEASEVVGCVCTDLSQVKGLCFVIMIEYGLPRLLLIYLLNLRSCKAYRNN